MNSIMKQDKKRQGFTLVELSIVLVIIGLIVGGVLVGQDMIQSAEIRSTVAQIQEFDTAKNLFKDKYGQLPGDGTRLNDFGFTMGDAATNGSGHSDGDGRIEDCDPATTGNYNAGCETIVFWLNLNEAQLTPFAPLFSGTGDEDTDAVGGDLEDEYLPEIDIGNGNRLYAFELNGLNYYYLANILDMTDVTDVATPNVGDALSPIQAENIDRKMDDGKPNTGSVVAMAHAGQTTVTEASDAGALGDCATGVVRNSIYNTDENNIGETDALACQLRFRMN